MHHRSARHRDIDAALDPAVGADDEMANVFPGRRVDGRVQFSGLRIEVGMRRETAGQGAVEVASTHGVELVVEFDGQVAGFHDGEGFARVADHVGVGDAAAEIHLLDRPFHRRPPLGGHHVIVSHVAVAVRERLSVTDVNVVHHAAAEKPMMVFRIGINRVRADAQQVSRELFGDLPRDRQRINGEFIIDGAEVPGEKGIFTHACPPELARPIRLYRDGAPMGFAGWGSIAADTGWGVTPAVSAGLGRRRSIRPSILDRYPMDSCSACRRSDADRHRGSWLPSTAGR